MGEPSNSDIMYKLGEITGVMKTFTEGQAKINDELFTARRNHSDKINSLLQTRRTQNKLIGYGIAGWAVIAEVFHRVFPHISQGP